MQQLGPLTEELLWSWGTALSSGMNGMTSNSILGWLRMLWAPCKTGGSPYLVLQQNPQGRPALGPRLCTQILGLTKNVQQPVQINRKWQQSAGCCSHTHLLAADLSLSTALHCGQLFVSESEESEYHPCCSDNASMAGSDIEVDLD